MQDMQDDAKRQKKLEEYNKKTDEIKRRLETLRNNYTGEGSHMDSAHNAGMSGMEDYDSGVNYQSAVLDQEEIEIQEKIKRNEEKMQRAFYNKLRRLEEQKANLQYQSEQVRNRLNQACSDVSHKEHETLNRYCERQLKSSKILKRKQEEQEEHVQWKRQKQQEADNMRKMKIRENFTQHMKKMQKDVNEYQERWQQTGLFSHEAFEGDHDIEKKVKRNLRVQDQSENLKRILNQQKDYKMILVQDMLNKERKFREFSEFRKSIALP